MAAALQPSESEQPSAAPQPDLRIAPHPSEAAAPPAATAVIEPMPQPKVRPYDFRPTALLPAAQLRKLRQAHDEFARSLSGRLSIHLRLEVTLTLKELQTIPCGRFLEKLAEPTCLTLFKAEPLRGLGVLDVPSRLALTLVDRLLGGPGQAGEAARELSEVETALLEQFAQLVLNDWCQHWKSVQELRPVILGHESNPRFLQLASRDTPLMVLVLETKVGDCAEAVHLALPCHALEPILRYLETAVATPAPPQSQAAPLAKPKWNPLLDEAVVPVTAQWRGMEITVRELARLKVGDVLELSAQCAGQVQLCLAQLPKFIGRLGARDNHWAVEITGASANPRPRSA